MPCWRSVTSVQPAAIICSYVAPCAGGSMTGPVGAAGGGGGATLVGDGIAGGADDGVAGSPGDAATGAPVVGAPGAMYPV